MVLSGKDKPPQWQRAPSLCLRGLEGEQGLEAPGLAGNGGRLG